MIRFTVLCKMEDGKGLTTGENVTLEIDGDAKPPLSADIVILLEEVSCLKGTKVSQMMKILDHAMKSKGITENRYAIIGFGGKSSFGKPHIRTISGRVWTHTTLFKLPRNIAMDGDNNGSLYAAIKLATQLPFRAGVSKNLISFTCGDEGCGENKLYADILTLLVENDIKLHMLTPTGFTTKVSTYTLLPYNVCNKQMIILCQLDLTETM